jgi:hypothetical protein
MVEVMLMMTRKREAYKRKVGAELDLGYRQHAT